MVEVVSIEETNRIRKSIGLPLLAVPGGAPASKISPASDSESGSDSDVSEKASTIETRTAAGFDNYKRHQEEVKQRKSRQARKEEIKKARDAQQRVQKLEGKGLGDNDQEEQDTMSWLRQQNKRQKKIDRKRAAAQKMESELRAREEALQYTSKDLAGVKVAHEFGDLAQGQEEIMVLKDATIDQNEEEGDELENTDIAERERLEERLGAKKRKPVYNPMDDLDEDGEKKAILANYDETIDGKKRKRFTLDVDGSSVEQKEAAARTIGERLKAQPISLDILKELSAGDYAEARDVKIRKPKKQKKSTRTKAAEEDEIFPTADLAENLNGTSGTKDDTNAMEVDGAAQLLTKKAGNFSFVDDEDLQASLAKQRRDALKKRKRARPEDLARQLRDEEANSMQEDQDDGDNGVVIDETTFFIDNIDERAREVDAQREVAAEREAAAQTKGTSAATHSLEADHDGDVDMEGHSTETNGFAAEVKREERTDGLDDEAATTGLDAEETFTRGLGSTFSLIKGRGMWEGVEEEANTVDRKSDFFKSEKRRIEADAERKARQQRLGVREADRNGNRSQREREELNRHENQARQQQESQKMSRFYNEHYQPNFTIEYKDDDGRLMNAKEAFKSMSHQFHGKGSGKLKTEKHLKKIEEEKQALAKSALDNSQMSNMSNAAGQTAKRTGTFGVALGK